jgi:sialate O-acetylesterase
MKSLPVRFLVQSGIGLLVLLSSVIASAEIRLPKLVGDNMVLQRDQKLTIWGWADPGEAVTLQFLGKSYTGTGGKDGKWTINLPAIKAGGPHEMIIRGKTSTLTIRNILVGDVWLASGQSNMEWKLKQTVTNHEQEIANANYPQLRFIDVANKIAFTPQTEFDSEGWKICNPQNAPEFSAVAYFFVRNLHQQYKVPMGVIMSEWGGTPAEAWVSASTLKTFPEYQASVTELLTKGNSLQTESEVYLASMREWETKISAQDRGFSENPLWTAAELDTDNWPVMKLPTLWEPAGLPEYDGVVWFRKEIDLPASMAGKELELYLGPIDDIDSTWFNGVKVGHTNGYNIDRKYTIPADLVMAGHNVITVRVIDTGGGGGMNGQEEQMKITGSGQSLSLAGEWRYNTALDLTDMPKRPSGVRNQNSPAMLYNGMIAPLVPYAIRGAIWYQGESNAGRAYQYRTLFPAMIKDWRSQWGYDFPFLFVQLANFMKTEPEPVESDWAELREAQAMTLALPKTGMAVIIDVGEADDIHPRNKQDVGKRLALSARRVVYGESNVVHSGPSYKSMKIEGNKIRLTFANTGSGLVASGGELKEFAIAGPDKQFVWAEARIEGNTIVVSSDKVPAPVAVRYAWANNPDKANLFNKEGLPASPFRTDDWPGLTVGKK